MSDFDRIRPPRARSSRQRAGGGDDDGPMALFTSTPGPAGPRGGRCSVTCAACRATRAVTLAGLVRALWPATVVLPWKWHPVLGRCPSCRRRAWLRVRCGALRGGG